MSDEDRVVYLMRGLPGCGKSHKARRLANHEGVVLEADEYFHTQVGDDPAEYSYREDLAPAAQDWDFERFREAISHGLSPVVVDRGNGRHPETRRYAAYAIEHGYTVEIAEPDSPWWLELRTLLKYKQYVAPKLFDIWARQLSEATRHTHRVDPAIIRLRMTHWRHNLTVEDIMSLPDE